MGGFNLVFLMSWLGRAEHALCFWYGLFLARFVFGTVCEMSFGGAGWAAPHRMEALEGP